jgi:hypothetical protein
LTAPFTGSPGARWGRRKRGREAREQRQRPADRRTRKSARPRPSSPSPSPSVVEKGHCRCGAGQKRRRVPWFFYCARRTDGDGGGLGNNGGDSQPHARARVDPAHGCERLDIFGSAAGEWRPWCAGCLERGRWGAPAAGAEEPTGFGNIPRRGGAVHGGTHAGERRWFWTRFFSGCELVGTRAGLARREGRRLSVSSVRLRAAREGERRRGEGWASGFIPSDEAMWLTG